MIVGRDLTRDMDILISKMEHGQVFRGLMIVNEKANPHYNIDFMRRMYTEEGRSHFTVRDNVLGHSQQGGIPSSFDRNMSTKLAAKTVAWLAEQLDHFASKDGTNIISYAVHRTEIFLPHNLNLSMQPILIINLRGSFNLVSLR